MENELARFFQNIRFREVSCIFIKSDGHYANVLDNLDDIIWIPSAQAAAIAKNTGIGDGIREKRKILLRVDQTIVGLYEFDLVIADEEVQLIRVMPLEIEFSRQGAISGTYMEKAELISLINAQANAA